MKSKTSEDPSPEENARIRRSREQTQRQVDQTIARIRVALGMSVDQVADTTTTLEDDDSKPRFANQLQIAGRYSGIFLQEVKAPTARETLSFVREGYPVVIDDGDKVIVIEPSTNKRIEATQIDESVKAISLKKGKVRALLRRHADATIMIAKRELVLNQASIELRMF